MRWPGEGDHQPHHDAGENRHQCLPPEADGEEAEKQIAGGVPVPIVVAEEEDEEENHRQNCRDCGARAIHSRSIRAGDAELNTKARRHEGQLVL